MSEFDVLDIFPVNGLDRSLHAPVFVGLLWITYFAETLGWTYAGLVVPGYFAAVIISAPATAVLVLVETVLTYWASFIIGKWIPRGGAWSTSFGRERFFLLVVISLAVRLALEGNLLPFLQTRLSLPHDRELHSLGLVLVPLLANMFWNAGIKRSLPRVALLTGLTYLVVDGLLLRYTNFTVSRFQVANESVSLSFLEAPHAQLILVIGALLAARANVLYGWDYNGILVPALLSVAWYQPSKLVTTVVEALVIYGLSRLLVTLPPFKRYLIVGTRRVLTAFSIGFALKWAGGFFALHFFPQVHMVDYLGFGYLLPTLLAVKMWNRDTIGPILVPTIQVSIMAFVLGNALGYGLSLLGEEQDPVTLAAYEPQSPHGPGTALLLADTAPAPDIAAARLLPAVHHTLSALSDLVDETEIDWTGVRRAGLVVQRHGDNGTGYWSITPSAADPSHDRAGPRIAVRQRPARHHAILLVAEGTRPGSPLPVLAEQLAEAVDARGFLLTSDDRSARAARDEDFAKRVAETLGTTLTLRIQLGDQDQLEIVGNIPRTLSIDALGSAIDKPIAVRFVSLQGDDSWDNAPTLYLTQRTAGLAAARFLRPPEVVTERAGLGAYLSNHLQALTTVEPKAAVVPTIQELRLFRAAIHPAFAKLAADALPDPWTLALSQQLHYGFVRLVDQAGHTTAWLLREAESPERRGNATWVRRPRAHAHWMLEVPAVRWELGIFRAGLVLSKGLNTDSLLLPGSLPTAAVDGSLDMRRPEGLRSFYHVIHQAWVDGGKPALVIHGISEENAPKEDVVLSNGSEAARRAKLPDWSSPLLSLLDHNGLRPALFDGSPSLAPFEGGGDPALSYARRFARGTTLLLWLSPSLRQRFIAIQEDQHGEWRASRLAPDIPTVELLDEIARFRTCAGPKASPDGCADTVGALNCALEEAEAAFEQYVDTHNPYALVAALGASDGCRRLVVRDADTGLLWGLVAGQRTLCLVPLLGGPLQAHGAVVHVSALQSITATGLSSLCVEAGP